MLNAEDRVGVTEMRSLLLSKRIRDYQKQILISRRKQILSLTEVPVNTPNGELVSTLPSLTSLFTFSFIFGKQNKDLICKGGMCSGVNS